MTQIRPKTAKLTVALTLAALVLTIATWQVTRVRAFNPQPDPPGKFLMVGITPGQTLRLNVVNLITAGDRQIPPGPCRVVLSFRDAAGHVIDDANGQPIRRTVELQAGESAFLDLNGDQLGGVGTNLLTRLEVRPFVRVVFQTDPGNLPPPCRANAEVFDNLTLRTSLMVPGGN
jgi:hypothetical protein